MVVNPSAHARGGLVEVVVTGRRRRPGPTSRSCRNAFGLPGSITLDGETVRNMLGLIQGSRIDNDTYITDVTLAEDDTGLDITIVIGTEPREGVPVEEIKRELYTRLTARPDTEVRLSPRPASGPPDPGPPGAGARASDGPGSSPRPSRHPAGARRRRRRPGVTLTNGLVTVAIDPDDGTFALDGVPGYGRLVDGGDHGDTYNYSPPAVDTVVDSPDVGVGRRR